MGWSEKYKKSINCDNPKGFSQRAHCQGRKKKMSEAKEQDHEVSMAKAQVKGSIDNLKKIARVLAKKTDADNLPAWVQAKLTDTEHNTNAAASYMGEEKKKCGDGEYWCKTDEKCKKIPSGHHVMGNGDLMKDSEHEEGGDVSESRKSGDYSLHDWFTKSRASDGTPGWVQLGGKYAGKPCAKQPGQKTKPKCGSSKMAAAMSDKEEDAAAKRKRAQDPNPNRKGKAKNVATESKRKKNLNASYSNWRAESESLNEFLGGKPGDGYIGHPNLDIKNPFAKKQTKKEVLPNARGGGMVNRVGAGIGDARMRQNAEIQRLLSQSNKLEGDLIEQKNQPYKVGDTIPASATQTIRQKISAAGNKYGKKAFEKEMPEFSVVEEKDACYKKVKSRYKVWPSAYASGALVKCRKVGAANWGNKSEGFSNWREEILFEGRLEDRLSKMSDDEFEQFIKGRTGPEADTFKQKRASSKPQSTPSPSYTYNTSGGTGKGPKMNWTGTTTTTPRTRYSTPDQTYQRRTTVNPAAERAAAQASKDAAQARRASRSGSGLAGKVLGAIGRGVRKNKWGILGVGAAALGAKLIGDLQNKMMDSNPRKNRVESFNNWKDNYIPMEIETVNIIEAKPLKDKKKKVKRWWDDDGDGIGWEKGEVKEDWQSVNKGDKTDGMSQKAVDAYRRENPGSKLKTAVTEKNPGGKRAKRRKSFCARSNGQKKMHNIDCSKTPDKAICKARKRWRC